MRSLLVLFGLLCVACGQKSEESRPFNVSDTESGNPAADASADGNREGCEAQKVQTLGAACCEDYGIDACGAGLFCAKLDGRTVATCYANNVRKPEETCTADVQCTTESCATSGRCAAAGGTACQPKDGCEKGYVCSAYLGDLTVAAKCQAIGDLEYCGADSNCRRGEFCRSGHCLTASAKYAGEKCTQDSECVDQTAGCFSGFCQCHKNNAWGCPTGTVCSGGNHVVYGHQCN